jgi:hypothetical protein
MLLFVRQSARRPINKFGIKGWELPAPQHTILTTDLILFPMFFCILILVYHVFCYQKRIFWQADTFSRAQQQPV